MVIPVIFVQMQGSDYWQLVHWVETVHGKLLLWITCNFFDKQILCISHPLIQAY